MIVMIMLMIIVGTIRRREREGFEGSTLNMSGLQGLLSGNRGLTEEERIILNKAKLFIGDSTIGNRYGDIVNQYNKIDQISDKKSIDKDSSGNGNNLIMRGNASMSTENGIFGHKYLVLNGRDNYAEMPTTLNLYNIYNNTTSIGGEEKGITFSIWFKASGGGVYARIIDFSLNASGVNPENFIAISKDGTRNNLRFKIYNEDSLMISQQFMTNGINFYDNKWRHICWTISDVGLWNIYINGVSQSGNPYLISQIPNINYTTKYIGKSSFEIDEYNTDGGIDDFRIYNKKLSAAEVMNIYNSSNKNIVTWYKSEI